jgi:hypothetical protein
VGATTLATIIAMVAAKLLNAYWSRTDVTDAARYRVYQEMQAANDRAGQWKAVAWADPVRAAELGVLPGAKGLSIDADHKTTSSDVPPR